MGRYWGAIRYHLPIVSFNSLDDWKPSDSVDLVIPNLKDNSEIFTTLSIISPGTYAYLVMIFHFVLLPMAVFAASRKVLRRREVG